MPMFVISLLCFSVLACVFVGRVLKRALSYHKHLQAVRDKFLSATRVATRAVDGVRKGPRMPNIRAGGRGA